MVAKEKGCCSDAPCDLVGCSTSDLPDLHYLLEFAQTLICWVDDAIQPSHPLLPPFLLLSIFPSIRVFSNESALSIRWPKYWSFRFSISPSNKFSGLISFRIDWDVYFLLFYLAILGPYLDRWVLSIWNLSSLTRDWTWAPCIESVES